MPNTHAFCGPSISELASLAFGKFTTRVLDLACKTLRLPNVHNFASFVHKYKTKVPTIDFMVQVCRIVSISQSETFQSASHRWVSAQLPFFVDPGDPGHNKDNFCRARSQGGQSSDRPKSSTMVKLRKDQYRSNFASKFQKNNGADHEVYVNRRLTEEVAIKNGVTHANKKINVPRQMIVNFGNEAHLKKNKDQGNGRPVKDFEPGVQPYDRDSTKYVGMPVPALVRIFARMLLCTESRTNL